jgi:putative endonuclease
MARFDGIATYMMASCPGGIIYTGSTSDLSSRVFQHKNRTFRGFSAHYGCTLLVWFEWHAEIGAAVHRERLLKHWLRAWKIRLIQEANPEWRDLADDWWPESTWDFDGSHERRLRGE